MKKLLHIAPALLLSLAVAPAARAQEGAIDMTGMGIYAQAMASAFGPGKADYNQVYEGIIKGSGLRNNDFAAALASCILLSWMVANDVQDGNATTVPMAQGVRAQVAPLLAPKPTPAGAAAQLGEELKLQTAILQAGWQAARKGGQLPAFRQRVGSSFQSQYHFDLTQMKLTDKGLAKR
jgi:hypothetical protein